MSSVQYLCEDNIDSEFLCPICFSPFEEPMFHQPCLNTFCKQCILDVCPLCRGIINEHNFVKVPRAFQNLLDKLQVICTKCNKLYLKGTIKNHECVQEISSNEDITQTQEECVGKLLGCEFKLLLDYKETNIEDLLTHQQSCSFAIQQITYNKILSLEYQNRVILDRLENLKITDKNSTIVDKLDINVDKHTLSNYLTSWSTWWGKFLERDAQKLTIKSLIDTSVSCRSVFPIDYSASFYFECEILNSGSTNVLAIGTIGDQNQFLSKLPGLGSGIGYHSNGYLYKGNDNGAGKPYGPIYQRGDVVGCGYDNKNDSLFFTKNGELIAFVKAPKLASPNDKKQFLSVGFCSKNASVVANFGNSDFIYLGIRKTMIRE